MKTTTILVILSTISASAYAKAQIKGLLTSYDCKGQANGNYNHPNDCEKFITCSNGNAYEMDCAGCHIEEGPERCPAGKLHYYKPLDRCEWANVANCTAGPSTTEEPITKPTTSAPIDSSTTEDSAGDICDPKDCKLEGNCTFYRKCNKDTSRWEDLKCADTLFWNPDWNADQIGGSCDHWDNLSDKVRDNYKDLEHCFPDCYFEKDGECSNSYIFHPAGTDHRITQTLFCPNGLIWDQEQETCDFCHNVLNSADGTSCC